MAYPLSVRDALCQDIWDLATIGQVARLYPSTINERDYSSIDDEVRGQTPLHRVLLDPIRCTLPIVELLLSHGADPNMKIHHGESSIVLCLVHQEREKVEIMRVLVEAGGKVSNLYDISLSYALWENMELEVVKLLLSAGADLYTIDSTHQSPIAHAVNRCDIVTFKTLLGLQDVDINVARNNFGGSLLHSAVETPGCTADFVAFLIDKGIMVNSVDKYKDTPLHCAVTKNTCHPHIIDVLLKRGASVDVRNEEEDTPLDIAIVCYLDTDILQSLLKSCFLQNPQYASEWINQLRGLFAIRAYVSLRRLNTTLRDCANGCRSEIQRMASEDIGYNRTLFDFLRMYSGNQMSRISENGFDIGKILILISNKRYPVYSDVIVSKLGRSLLLEKLEECHIRAPVLDNRCDMLRVTITVLLNTDCTRRLADELDDADLLSFILACM